MTQGRVGSSNDSTAPLEQDRQDHRISLSAIAKHLHCSVQQASRYCQGVNRPPDDIFPFISIQAAASLQRRHLEWMLAHRPRGGRPRSLRIEVKVPKGLNPEQAQQIVTAAFQAAMETAKAPIATD